MGLVYSDIRYALRQLRKSPAFSVVAILTLALGIGANTAMFSVVDAVLIRPLPYPQADRLMMVYEDVHEIGFPRNTPSVWNWQTWKRENAVFTDIAASRSRSITVTGDGEPELLPARAVTPNFWTVLATPPLLGRVFTEQEDRDKAPVVVISYGLWQRRFGGSKDVLGRQMILNGATNTVIGVMPRDFYFLPSRATQVWVPTSFSPQDLANAGSHFLTCMGRLKPGVTYDQASASMEALGKRMLAESPNHSQTATVVVPLREQLAGKSATSLIVLLCAAGCVLLISCANLANLLLARGAARAREVAVRTALGASRGRIVVQFLTESLVLAGAGAIAGLGLARPSMTFLESLVPSTMLTEHLSLDWRVLSFSAVMAIASGMIFGLVPAFGGSRVGIQQSLRDGGRGLTGPRRQWFQHSLIVAETALAVVLLIGGGVLIETLHHLRDVDLGLKADHLLTMNTEMSRYREFPRRAAYANSIVEKVRAVPGVINAAYISVVPLTETGNTSSYLLEGQTSTNNQDALFRVVTRDYFATVGAKLREGRFFDIGDHNSNTPVAIVNETFVKMSFPTGSPLGKRFQIGGIGSNRYWYTIVGVVKEIRDRGVSEDLKPVVYVVNEQADQAWPQPFGLMIRTSAAPLSIVPAVREAIWSVDKNQPISRIQTLENIVDTQLSEPSQDSSLLGAFAALALILACVGLYGVLSYAVAQRTNEIGIRMALGATSSKILVGIGRQGLTLTSIGLVLGLAMAAGVSRLITSLLYGFAPSYGLVVVLVSTTLLAVAAAACFVPARRASRVDPLVALRYE